MLRLLNISFNGDIHWGFFYYKHQSRQFTGFVFENFEFFKFWIFFWKILKIYDIWENFEILQFFGYAI